MAMKDAAEGWARAKPMRAMAAVVVAGLVFGGVVGTIAGFKIEQHRAATGVNRLKAKLGLEHPTGTATTQPTTHPGVKNSALVNERVGTVTAIGTDSLTLNTTRLGVLNLRTTSATRYENVRAATATAIKAGSRAVVTLGGDVLVVAANSLLGRPVTKVAGGSFSIAKANGPGVTTISLTKVKMVETTSEVPRADTRKNGSVLAAGHPAGKGVFATAEVVLLPAGSPFAK